MNPMMMGLLGPQTMGQTGQVQAPQGGGMQGLLENPAFMAGMGLLSAGYDSRVNPFQSAVQGLSSAQQFKMLEQKRKREEEQYQRQQKALEQIQGIVGPEKFNQQVSGHATGRLQDAPTRTLSTMNPRHDEMLAALAQTSPEAAIKAYIEQQDPVRQAQARYYNARAENGGGEIGQYNPRDYTTESWSRFVQSQNPSDLRRYEPFKDVMIGGVNHTFDPVQGRYVPANNPSGQGSVTPEMVGTNQGTVASTAADVEAAAERARNAPQEQFDIATLQRELDWVSQNEDDFKSLFGALDGRTPDVTQGARNAEAHRSRVANLLTLAARGQLKGQGTVSDFESRMLESAATLLNDRTISDEEAMKEVQRIQGALNFRSSRVPGESNETKPNTPEAVEDEYERMKRELLGG